MSDDRDPELWAAYCRAWGMIEGAGFRIHYAPTSPQGTSYSAAVYWDVPRVVVVRPDFNPEPPLHKNDQPLWHSRERNLRELGNLLHEMGHIDSERRNRPRWTRYYAFLCEWTALQGLGLGATLLPSKAQEVLDEEQRAEWFGEHQMRLIYPTGVDEFKARARRNLSNYRMELGLDA